MPDSRAFFHRPETHDLIQEFAKADRIAIYYGAGVTIDQGGLSWKEMCRALLWHALGGNNPARQAEVLKDVDAIMRNRPLVESASVASQRFEDRDKEQWRRNISNVVRDRIYGVSRWQRGRLAQALAILIATLRDLGRDVQVITTNYDGFVEEELVRYLSSLNIKATAMVTAPEHQRTAERGTHAITADQVHEFQHIHGYVSNPKELDMKDSPYLVLSERDYFTNESWALKKIKDSFEGRAVLIVGCSLDDNPLLQALADPLVQGDAPRFAVMPTRSLGNRGSGQSYGGVDYDLLRRTLVGRMKQFSTRVVFPDFYFQVAQLLQEISTWAGQASSGASYRTSETRYGMRLVGWWNDWSARCCSGSIDLAQNWWEKQVAIQKILVADLTEKISPILKAVLGDGWDFDARLKLELWVRWNPEDNRELRCFCSTVNLWTDQELMRTAPIAGDSSWASVSAFVSGRPQRIFEQGDQWPTYLAVPIGIELADGWVQVGALVLASQYSEEKSGITDENAEAVNSLVSALTTLGTALLQPTETDLSE